MSVQIPGGPQTIVVEFEDGPDAIWVTTGEGSGVFCGAFADEARTHAAERTPVEVLPGFEWVADGDSAEGAFAAIVASAGGDSGWQLADAPGPVLVKVLTQHVEAYPTGDLDAEFLYEVVDELDLENVLAEASDVLDEFDDTPRSRMTAQFYESGFEQLRSIVQDFIALLTPEESQ